MHIKNFKTGDIITRIQPSGNPSLSHNDRSYMNDKLEFIDLDMGIIFLVGNYCEDEYKAIKLSEDWWGESWEYFPTTLWEKTKMRAKIKTAEIKLKKTHRI